jgi:hypothetical protein
MTRAISFDGIRHHPPLPARRRHLRALIELSFLADHVRDPLDLGRRPFLQVEDVIQRVGDLPLHPDELHRHPHGKVALLHRSQGP